jgi:SepF-like predicted cell division protein (DUF552 family)
MRGVVGNEGKNIAKRVGMLLANVLLARGLLMENRKRNVQMIIRVTEEERALIEEKRQQIPTLNLSAYARKMLIDGYIITLDLQEVKGHTAQLQKIGVNVNQIAKRINETGRIYADDMDEIKRVMEEVWRLERRLLLQFKGLIK